MLQYISHRGNIIGKNKDKENSPSYIIKALEKGYEVEIDVWIIDNKFYLGHDEPQYRIKGSFLENNKLWCHAKNYEALNEMLKNKKIHCFWHQEDFYTITSKGIIWTYPGHKLGEKSICVLPEQSNYKEFNCLGICSDFIEYYKNM